MSEKTTKLLCLILAIVMVAGMLPVSALAVEEGSKESAEEAIYAEKAELVQEAVTVEKEKLVEEAADEKEEPVEESKEDVAAGTIVVTKVIKTTEGTDIDSLVSSRYSLHVFATDTETGKAITGTIGEWNKNSDGDWVGSTNLKVVAGKSYTVSEETGQDGEASGYTAYVNGCKFTTTYQETPAGKITSEPVTVNVPMGTPVNVTITNTYTRYPNLVITKTFKGITADKIPAQFSMVVDVPSVIKPEKDSKAAAPTVTYNSTTGKFECSDGEIEQLTSGIGYVWSLTLSTGEYEIIEHNAEVEPYTLDRMGPNFVEVPADGTKNVSIINEYSQFTNRLMIYKEVSGLVGNDTMPANASVKLSLIAESSANSFSKTIPFSDFTFDGEEEGIKYYYYILKDIPGGQYMVSEQNADDISGYKLYASVPNEVGVSSTGTSYLDLQNTYERQYGYLLISKVLDGIDLADFPTDTEFTIEGPSDFGDNGEFTFTFDDFQKDENGNFILTVLDTDGDGHNDYNGLNGYNYVDPDGEYDQYYQYNPGWLVPAGIYTITEDEESAHVDGYVLNVSYNAGYCMNLKAAKDNLAKKELKPILKDNQVEVYDTTYPYFGMTITNSYENYGTLNIIKEFKGLDDLSEVPDGFTVTASLIQEAEAFDPGEADEDEQSARGLKAATPTRFSATYNAKTGEFESKYGTITTTETGFSWALKNVLVGDYFITEDEDYTFIPGYEWEAKMTVNNNGTQEEVKGATVKEGETTQVTITNTYTRIYGYILITKSLGSDSEEVTIPDGTTFTIKDHTGKVVKTITYGEFEDGSILVKLPASEDYAIEETNAEVEGYAVVGRVKIGFPLIDDSGTVKKRAAEDDSVVIIAGDRFYVDKAYTEERPVLVDFINTYTSDYGYVTVTKRVEGLRDSIIESGDYTFKCEIGKKGVSKILETTTFEKTDEEGVYIAKFENIALPFGTYYVYEFEKEAEVDGYKLTKTISPEEFTIGNVATPATKAAVGDPVQVTITNTYERQYGQLSISKHFEDLDEELIPEKLSFVITGPDDFGENGTMTVKYSDFEDGSYKLGTVPAGEYTVKEENAKVPGYDRETYVYSIGKLHAEPIPVYPPIEEREDYEEAVEAIAREDYYKKAPAEEAAPDLAPAEELAAEYEDEERPHAEAILDIGELSDEITLNVDPKAEFYVNFTNTYAESSAVAGTLEITKVFEGISKGAAPSSLSFDISGPDEYEGPASITLADFEKTDTYKYVFTLEDVPAGQYSIVETAAEVSGYTLTGTAYNVRSATIDEAGETAAFTVTNTYEKDSAGFEPIPVPSDLNGDDHFAYIIGYKDGTVHPEANITRAEATTIFFRLLKDDVRNANFTKTNSFNDVKEGQWFNNAISTMAKMGIVNGYKDGTFRPNETITRAEFAAIAARFDKSAFSASADFTDISGHWASVAIAKAAANGWINGYPDGSFKPDQKITRAEAMALINRVLNRDPKDPSDLLPNMIKWSDNMNTAKWYYLDVQEATNSHTYERITKPTEKWVTLMQPRDWAALEK